MLTSRLALVLLLLGGCAATRRGEAPYRYAPDAQESQSEKKKEEEPKEEGRSVGHVLLLYIPNRFMDLFDVVRFGVDVGPGIGIIITPTEYLQLSLMTRLSVGLGYETLRHLPFKMGADSEIGFGPLTAEANPGVTWYRNTWDFRLEAQVLLVGAHVAVNPAEIADFILGFTTIDIMHDDW